MEAKKIINVARDFGTEPAGRFPTDGEYCGEAFREKLLWPALSRYERVVVEMDGTEGYGSSFLEEAFGGLVRIHGCTPSDLRTRLSLVSHEDESLLGEIWEYIGQE